MIFERIPGLEPKKKKLIQGPNFSELTENQIVPLSLSVAIFVAAMVDHKFMTTADVSENFFSQTDIIHMAVN